MTTQNSNLAHSTTADIPLSAAAGEAARIYGQTPPPGAYRKLQSMASDGQLAVIRRGGRIFVAGATMPAVGIALGMRVPEPVAA